MHPAHSRLGLDGVSDANHVHGCSNQLFHETGHSSCRENNCPTGNTVSSNTGPVHLQIPSQPSGVRNHMLPKTAVVLTPVKTRTQNNALGSHRLYPLAGLNGEVSYALLVPNNFPAFLQVSKNSADTLLLLKCLMKAFVSFPLITGIVRTGFANTVICSTSFLLSFASLCCLHIFYRSGKVYATSYLSVFSMPIGSRIFSVLLL